MLLQNRPSVSLRAICVATLLSLFIVFAANDFLFPSSGYHPFNYSHSCDASSPGPYNFIPNDPNPNSATPTVTITAVPQTVTIVPSVVTVPAATQTITKEIKITPSSVPGILAPVPTAIPEKLWYKLGPFGLKDDSKAWIDTCLDANPTYRHEFLTDASGDYYVQEYYANRPDIVSTYMSLPIPILKADLLRYLILYAEGGIWSDLDVSCEEVPNGIHSWIPDQYKEKTNLVVGLEFDMEWEGDSNLNSQFASWTIMCKPGSPHMKMVIEDILVGLSDVAKANNVSINGLTLDMTGDVVDMTGPKRMTRGIVKSLQIELGETIDDRNVSRLFEPRLLGDVLVLPGNAFASSQQGYPHDQGPALVSHHYSGSWKNNKGGELNEEEKKIKEEEDRKKEEEEKKKEEEEQKQKEETQRQKEEEERKVEEERRKKEEEDKKKLEEEEKIIKEYIDNRNKALGLEGEKKDALA